MKKIYYFGFVLVLGHAVPLSPMIEKSRKAFDSVGNFCKKDIVLAPLIFGGSAAVAQTGARLFGESSPVIASLLGDWQKQLLAATAVTGLFFGVRHLLRKDWKATVSSKRDSKVALPSVPAGSESVITLTANAELEEDRDKDAHENNRSETSPDIQQVISPWKTTVVDNEEGLTSPMFDFWIKSIVRHASSQDKVTALDGASHNGCVKIRIADVVTGDTVAVELYIEGSIKLGVLSNDGSKFLCYHNGVKQEGIVKVFDIETQKCLIDLKVHDAVNKILERTTSSSGKEGCLVKSVAFSPDCSNVVLVRKDGTVNMYEATTGTESFAYKSAGVQDRLKEGTTSVAMSPNNKWIAVGSPCSIKIFDVEKKKYRSLSACEQDGNILSIVFSPDSKLAAVGYDNGSAKIWKVENGECLFVLDSLAIRSLAFSPNGNLLASGSTDWTVKIWDVKRGTCLSTLEGYHSSPVNSVFFADDGSKVVSASNNTVNIWKLEEDVLQYVSGQQEEESLSEDEDEEEEEGSAQQCSWWKAVESHGRSVRTSPRLDFPLNKSTIFDPSLSEIISVVGHEVNFLDTTTGDIKKDSFDHENPPTWGIVSPNGSHVLFYFSDQGTIQIFDARVKNCMSNYYSYRIGKIHEPKEVIDSSLKNFEEALESNANKSRLRCAAFFPDNCRVIWVRNEGTAEIFNIKTGKISLLWQGDNFTNKGDQRNPIVIAPNNALIALGIGGSLRYFKLTPTGAEGKTKIDTESFDFYESAVEDVIESIAFSPNSEVVASGRSKGTIKIHQVQWKKLLHTLEGVHGGAVRSLTFSPDGKLLASGSSDCKVKVWDLETGKCLFALEGHTGPISSVFFGTNASEVISTSEDGTVKIWKIKTDENADDEVANQ